MLGSCKCSFKSKSNLFGSFFFCSFFIVLTRFLCSFLFFAYLRYVQRRIDNYKSLA